MPVTAGSTPSCPRTSGRLDQLLVEILDELELEYERPDEGAFLVKLPGKHKLATMCWLVVGDHACSSRRSSAQARRGPPRGSTRCLLQRNARMYGVAFSDRPAGDVYLVGRLPLPAITAEEVDRLLGCVLTLRRRDLRPAARDRLRLLDPARVGLAHKRGESHGQPAGLRPLRRPGGVAAQTVALGVPGRAGSCSAGRSGAGR